MDKDILHQYIDACELVKETEEEIRRIKRQRKTIVQGVVKGSSPDFPYTPQNFHIEGLSYSVIQDPGRAEDEILLGEDEYFVLGDNRNNSTDGRAELVGNIHKDDIIGRAWVRIYPFEKFGKLKHQ